ncbi:hypothetical protein CKM354_000932400 [Cercospora kikuchii]|uniref:Polyketide synthase n=1 Tax=Cercospora kikuchii TaxID=84275 RepID=A0A9P3FJ35_9PEZI|nr:uncharacterized protein CKM354_000932400 [Cercospora kikuchii]GIZ46187.1 hypothetical protein CKM354_000932400 [Cercospora kikuchii]
MSGANVAIIGVACRFPGKATTPSGYLDMLMEGGDAWTKVPGSRYNADAFHHPFQGRRGSIICNGGYFLKDDIAKWDAPFFGLSAAEARAVDPQQRLLLELAYESLENAGISIESIADTNMGCYMGTVASNYKGVIGRDPLDTPRYTIVGCASSMLANRISWFLNIRGPSVTLDTACSSSAAALHLACEGIKSSSSTTRCALVGASNLAFDPDDLSAFSALGFLSPESHCFAFDARANGYARGEGVSVLVLKHLDDAIRDGDPIRAVIKATGMNSDGRTAGIALPSSHAQQRLISSTYALAALDPNDTQYVEMHGTGTKAGDPAEMQAVLGALAGQRPSTLYCGSVKTQIGHLEAAAGVAGIVKCILAMEVGVIPPNRNFETPNPTLAPEIAQGRVAIPTTPLPWPSSSAVRRCSVNSFGFGGTNVHIVLEAATDSRGIVETPHLESKGLPYVFVLSSPVQGGVARQCKAHHDYVERLGTSNHRESFLPDLMYTLNQRRSIFRWRHAVLARNINELLTGWAESRIVPTKALKARVALLFTGQGAQWPGMGRELMLHPIFAQSIRASATCLRELGAKWDAEVELLAPKLGSRIHAAEFSQPLCAVLQMALVDLFLYWGLSPVAVVGHSSGEIAAAYAAGALGRRDCLTVALHRGIISQAAQEQSPGRSMMAVGLSSGHIQRYLDDKITLACINSPESVTVAGHKGCLDTLRALLQSESIFCRMLRVEIAYHSPQLFPFRDEYHGRIACITPNTDSNDHAAVPFYSTVYGRRIPHSQLNADYWVANLCSTVDLVSALNILMDSSVESVPDIMVEIGPHGGLAAPFNEFRRTRDECDDTFYCSALSRQVDANTTAMGAAASLWARGVSIDLKKLNERPNSAPDEAVLTDLPSYQWNHSTAYWHETRMSRNRRFPTFARHDLFGSRSEAFNPQEPVWVNRLRVPELPWLSDHQIQGQILFPFTGVICSAIEAMRQLEEEWGTVATVSSYELRDITMLESLVIPKGDNGVETSLHFTKRKAQAKTLREPWYDFSLYSVTNDIFVEHGCGSIRVTRKDVITEVDGGTEAGEEVMAYRRLYRQNHAGCTETVSGKTHYEYCDSIDVCYGPTFQGVNEVHHNMSTACFEVKGLDFPSAMPKGVQSSYLIHPAMLDALMQPIFVAVRNASAIPKQTWVPLSIDSLDFSSGFPQGIDTRVHGTCTSSFDGQNSLTCDLMAGDGAFNNLPYVILKGLQCRGIELPITSSDGLGAKIADSYSRIMWKPDFELLGPCELKQFLLALNHGQSAVDMEPFLRDAGHILGKMCEIAATKFSGFPTNGLPMHLQKYLQWMRTRYPQTLDHLDAGINTTHNAGSASDQLSNISELVQEFSAKYPSDGPLMHHVLNSLDDVLRQKTTPIEAMTASKHFTRFYREAYGMTRIETAFQRLFDLIAHKKPDLHVLEVGAGTASTTLPILQTLSQADDVSPRLAKWTFTDFSAGWFDSARRVLSDWQSYIDYKVLDIENDPVGQGFESESYDVVVAVNVIHATKDIRQSLRHCHRMLKPGGHLVLGEITGAHDLGTFVFGILPGWWLAEDGRHNGPLLLPKEWAEQLEETGFTRARAMVHDGDQENMHRMSMIVSQKTNLETDTISKDILIITPTENSNSIKHLASNLEQCIAKSGVTAITKALDHVSPAYLEEKTCISLLEMETPLLDNMDATQFLKLQTIFAHAKELLWLAKSEDADGHNHPSFRIISGLMRCLKMEDATRRFMEVHIEDPSAQSAAALSQMILSRLASCWTKGNGVEEIETSQRQGTLCIPRYLPDTNLISSLARATGREVKAVPKKLSNVRKPLRLVLGKPGLLETLHFVDLEVPKTLGDEQVEIKVTACGLNFLDVLIAIGEIHRAAFGHEAVGIVCRTGAKVEHVATGDRVVWMSQGSMQTEVRVSASSVHRAPAHLTDEELASIPVAYCTAYRCLVEVAHLQRGESVLIHAAAGGLGQALIQVAKSLGANIFCTVSTHTKKEAVVAMGVAAEQVFSSRDLTFEKGIMRTTNGKGVDIVVNSLAGEALRRSWFCLSSYGRFIEVGKRDILGNSKLDMSPFLRNATFAAVNLEPMMDQPEDIRRLMDRVFSLLKQDTIGLIRPITVYDFANAERAFRDMQRGTHLGKLVLRFTTESVAPVKLQTPFTWTLDSEATYLLVGGLGGLGRAQAEYMVQHGARHLAFISRSGKAGKEASDLINRLVAAGVSAKTYACDVAEKDELTAVLEDIASTMPPIRGVIQGAMVLQDTVFHKMAFEQWVKATRPKIQGSWNLHELLPKDLDFFVMLSSLAGIIGAILQANYAAGNTYQDQLAYYRRSKGLPAVSLNLGAIEGIGFVAENKSIAVGASRMPPMPKEQFFHMLGCAMAGMSDSDEPTSEQILSGTGSGGRLQEMQKESPHADLPFLRMLAPFAFLKRFGTDRLQKQETDTGAGLEDSCALLASCDTLDEASVVVQKLLVGKIASIISLLETDIDTALPISSYGVDSLIAVELRNWISSQLHSDISIFELTSTVAIHELSRKIAERLPRFSASSA